MDNEILQLVKNEFISEAQEIIESVELEFIELEKNPHNPDIINKIFRHAHTLKGASLTAGFEHFGNFAHVFENVLTRIRSQEIAASASVIDALLKAIDTLRSYVDAIAQDMNAQVDTSAAEAALQAVISDSSLKGHKGSIRRESPARVLLCDDEEQVLQVLEACLKKMGITKIEVAADGQEAWEKISRSDFDLIITDYLMPKMDGITFIEKVRDAQLNIPVIFISGHAERSQVVEFIHLGAHDFIEKPFDIFRVSTIIRNALKAKLVDNSVKELSILNFRAYLAMLKVLDHPDCPDSMRTCAEVKMVETYLDKISKLTNEILSEDAPCGVLQPERTSSVA